LTPTVKSRYLSCVRIRALGKTGLRVSEMALGTWGLSGDGYGAIDAADARRVIERALELGVTIFDTADAYGGGAMEKLLGEVVGKHPAATIVTKGGTDRSTEPARKRFEHDYIRASAEKSLKRLGRDRIDLYLLHNPSVDALLVNDAVDAVTAMKREGLIGAWGVSAGDSEVARTAIQRGAEVIEVAYNLVHSIDLHRLAGEIMIARVGVLARSTLAYGLLTGEWKESREFDDGDHRRERWTKLELERRLQQIDALRYLVRGDVKTLRAAALRFVLANNLVSSAVLGARSVEQLDQLIGEVGSGPLYLPDEEMSKLPMILSRVGIAT
jgi:aryl-alcohol dehydrogenase-like predicted oxidoreductase